MEDEAHTATAVDGFRHKRSRVIDQYERNPTTPAVSLPLEKDTYSKQEVQVLMDQVERQYTLQLEAYHTYLRELLLSDYSKDAHRLTYVS
jgi:hypothetical protein